jgi:hypothetical protein
MNDRDVCMGYTGDIPSHYRNMFKSFKKDEIPKQDRMIARMHGRIDKLGRPTSQATVALCEKISPKTNIFIVDEYVFGYCLRLQAETEERGVLYYSDSEENVVKHLLEMNPSLLYRKITYVAMKDLNPAQMAIMKEQHGPGGSGAEGVATLFRFYCKEGKSAGWLEKAAPTKQANGKKVTWIGAKQARMYLAINAAAEPMAVGLEAELTFTFYEGAAQLYDTHLFRQIGVCTNEDSTDQKYLDFRYPGLQGCDPCCTYPNRKRCINPEHAQRPRCPKKPAVDGQ